VFTYSGHGTWAKDASGDEPDRRTRPSALSTALTTAVSLDDEIGSILGERKFGVPA
jgi:hypothetical protein